MKTTKAMKILCLLLTLILLIPAGAMAETAKKTITVMVDHDFRVDDIGNYLSAKYPDVDFDIILGRTNVTYLQKAADNGSLADIIISSNISGRNSVSLNPYLYDLSATDIASEFYTVYLDNYTTADGKLYWLPGCAAIEGIMANKALFDQYGIELPTDYASFVEVCNKFTELGIRPYASDYKYDYTDAYLLQSLSIPLLQTRAGRSWRIDFETGETDTLDETIGLQMFEKLASFFELTGVTPDDAKRGYGATFSEFTSGSIAMIRQSTNNSAYYQAGMTDLVILPYFGDTAKDNWYFTTPSYTVAMKGDLKGGENEELCLDIVRTLFSQECMDIFANEVQAFTAYNKNITFAVQDQFQNIIPYVESNHMYTYLSLQSVQSASKVAVQKMIAEGASPAEALAAFNEAVVQKPEDEPVAATFETGYTRNWTDHGSEALSAVVNTMAQISGAEILLAPFSVYTSDVYAGDYTSTELDNLIYGGGLNFDRKTVTGAELKKIVSVTVSGAGTSYDPISLGTLPGISGAKMIVSKAADGKYQLDDLLVNGESVKDDATFDFVFVCNTTTILEVAYGWKNEEHDGRNVVATEGAEGIDWETYDGFVCPDHHVVEDWLAYFADGGKIAAPTDYIQVK